MRRGSGGNEKPHRIWLTFSTVTGTLITASGFVSDMCQYINTLYTHAIYTRCHGVYMVVCVCVWAYAKRAEFNNDVDDEQRFVSFRYLLLLLLLF